jgi:hypothetical protein
MRGDLSSWAIRTAGQYLREHEAQVCGERGHIIRTTTQVWNKHPVAVSRELDERVEHRACNQKTMEQKQRLTFTFDAEEDAIGRAVLLRPC